MFFLFFVYLFLCFFTLFSMYLGTIYMNSASAQTPPIVICSKSGRPTTYSKSYNKLYNTSTTSH